MHSESRDTELKSHSREESCIIVHKYGDDHLSFETHMYWGNSSYKAVPASTVQNSLNRLLVRVLSKCRAKEEELVGVTM